MNLSYVKKLEINNSDYNIQTVYEHQSKNEELLSFNFDLGEDKMILLTRSVKKPANQKGDFLYKIFDVGQSVVLVEGELHSAELIHRLLTCQLMIIDGHIYYGNNVIKLRYDLLQQKCTKSPFQTLNQCTFFDIYNKIFELKHNLSMLTGAPLRSQKYHRLGYLVLDRKCAHNKSILIVPYLHERRVYLNRTKLNNSYFYTVMELRASDESFHKISLVKKHMKVPHIDDSVAEDSVSRDTKTRIVCMNLTVQKFYCYSQSGLLLNARNISDFCKKYGDPICCSSNGQNMIFKKHER